jgi:hypothetical protein
MNEEINGSQDGEDKDPGLEEGKQPLTGWKNPPKLSDLKQDLLDAKPIHDMQKSRISAWLDNLNVTGAAKVKTPEGNSAIVPKLIRKQAEWRYAALSEPFLSTEDIFNCKPKTWEDREAAQQNQLLLNYQFNTAINKVKFIDEYVRAAVDEGTVIVKPGWEFEEEEYQCECPDIQFVVNPEFAQLHEQLAQLKQESPSEYQTNVPDELKEAHELSIENGKPIEPRQIGMKTETRTRTLVNRPTVEVCDHRNVVFDPTCMGDMDKCGFAIETFESSLSVLRKDKRYKNLDKIKISDGSILSQPDHAPAGGNHNFNFADEPRKKFVVHQYWGGWDIDGDGKVKPIVVAWVGDVEIRMEDSPFPDKSVPFIVEQYLPVRRSTYGEPDGALLEDNQKVLGAVTRGVMDIMGKSANGQTGIRRDMLDTTNRRKFDKGQDYEFNANVDPREGIFMHTYPEIPQSAQFMIQMQNMEAESLTGVKSWTGGISGKALGDVAAGVRGALDAASKRELGILRRLSNGIIKLGRKMVAMNAVFLSDEEVIRVTNKEFVKVRKDDLAGDFDIELSISTAEEDNNKAEQLAFMFQTIGPNGDQGMTKMILSDIARLRKMPDLAKKIEAFQPQPDPLMQEKMQLENELLRAQIAKENAMAAQYGARSQLDTAKVGTEVVKQENLQSDTDQKNLNFVEQESGVKQERDKELHGEQARSQGQLKLLEHSLTQTENAKDRQHDLLKEYVKSRAKK